MPASRTAALCRPSHRCSPHRSCRAVTVMSAAAGVPSMRGRTSTSRRASWSAATTRRRSPGSRRWSHARAPCRRTGPARGPWRARRPAADRARPGRRGPRRRARSRPAAEVRPSPIRLFRRDRLEHVEPRRAPGRKGGRDDPGEGRAEQVDRRGCTTGKPSSVTPSPLRACWSAMPNTEPTTRPSSPPKVQMSTDSVRIIRLTCLRAIPTARSRPSSRVRSITDSASVLITPRRAMRTDSPSRMLMIVTIWLTWVLA